MSLQVWLPLNGNMNNQGLSNITINDGTPNYLANGKTSSTCLNLNKGIRFTVPSLAGAKNWSVAFWFKINNDSSLSTDWIKVVSLEDQLEDNSATGRFRFETCYSSEKVTGDYKGLHWHDNPTNATTSNWEYVATDREVWHHACVTVGDAGIYTYCDGVLVNTTPKTRNNGHLTGIIDLGHTNYINGGIQDLRIYNHALSDKEVAEIAKGLILHYKLDNKGIGGENLALGTTKELLLYAAGGTNENTGAPDRSNFRGDPYQLKDTLSVLAANRKCNYLTISYDYEIEGENPSGQIAGGFNASPWEAAISKIADLSAVPRIGRVESTVTVSASGTIVTSTATKIRFRMDNVPAGIIIHIRNLKLEFSHRATPWCPAQADDLYQSLGFNSTEEVDCSGFGNNGTMVGTFDYDSNSPRYSASTIFNGTDTYIAAGTGAKVKDAITVSIWAYMDDWHNNGDVGKIRPISCTQSGGWAIEATTDGKMKFLVGTGTDSNAAKSAFSTMTRASMASGWHHFVGTYDGFNVKFYIDGVLQTTNAAYTTKTPIYYNSSNAIFIGDEAAGSATTPETSSDHNFNGKISDVRIYATALTANQVKELYNTSASIDRNGNLFCYEMEER